MPTVAVTELHMGCTRDEQWRLAASGVAVISEAARRRPPRRARSDRMGCVRQVDWNSLVMRAAVTKAGGGMFSTARPRSRRCMRWDGN